MRAETRSQKSSLILSQWEQLASNMYYWCTIINGTFTPSSLNRLEPLLGIRTYSSFQAAAAAWYERERERDAGSVKPIKTHSWDVKWSRLQAAGPVLHINTQLKKMASQVWHRTEARQRTLDRINAKLWRAVVLQELSFAPLG